MVAIDQTCKGITTAARNVTRSLAAVAEEIENILLESLKHIIVEATRAHVIDVPPIQLTEISHLWPGRRDEKTPTTDPAKTTTPR